MNTLLLNRDGFQMPADGWYQVAPLGEFAHAGAGVVQVVDVEACAAMVNRFVADAAAANFAGLLVDFDHFSLDGEKRSEAAGWITALENRDGGLFAQIRWSDLGEEAVKGGRYRFLSPVWSRSDCQDLGNGRVRPVRLLNAAVTNDPNLKGMRPLSNSAAGAVVDAGLANANAQPSTGVRFKWVLSGDGKHCPSCAAVAGQVHTMAEWDAAGIRPGSGALYCLGKCKCRLVETNEASTGAVTGVVKRHRPVVNRTGGGETGLAVGQLVSEAVREAKRVARAGMMANQGWTDEARAASLAVRRAKAEARERLEVGTEKKKGRAYTRPELGRLFQDVGYDAMTPGQIDNYVEFIRERMMDTQGEPSEVDRAFLREYSVAVPKMTDQNDPVQRWCVEYRRFAREVTAKTGMPAKEAMRRYQALLKQKGGVKGNGYLKKDDYAFFKAYRWASDAYRDNHRMRELDKLTEEAIEMFQDPNDRMKALIKIDTQRTNLRDAAKLREDWHSGKITSDAYYQTLREKYMKPTMQNRWSDTARKASLAVRKAKAAARKQKKDGKAAGKDGEVRAINPDAGKLPDLDTGIYLGGSKYFDESTGRYVWPKKKRRWEK